MQQPRIIPTEDGSCTLFLEDMDETYHSTHGAMAESLHVYIRNGLDLLKDRPAISILEIGFGTGLNALLTLDFMDVRQQINYYALEPYPLETTTIEAYYQGFEQKPESLALLPKLLQTPHHKLYPVRDNFQFCLLPLRLQDLQQEDTATLSFDLVYYDAFGPSKQSDMWTLETLAKATELMNKGGVLTTYCAQGQFKRHLKSLGLSVENPAGALGKRQMTVGRKQFIMNS